MGTEKRGWSEAREIREIRLVFDSDLCHRDENHQRLVRIPVDLRARKLTLRILGFNGRQDSGGVFAFDAK